MNNIEKANLLNIDINTFSKNRDEYIGKIDNLYLSNNQIDLSNIIMEMSNIYPTNLTKHTIHKKDYKIIRQIRSEAYAVCRTKIPMEYITHSFNKFKNGFLYYNENKLIAFCIWDIKDEYSLSIGKFKKLHIYLICGKKLDYNLVPRILDDVVYLCRKENIQYITLEPANEELKEYYIRCGFKKEEEVTSGIKYLMLDVSKSRMISYTTPDTIVRKRIIKTRKCRKNRKQRKSRKYMNTCSII
jgi:hypothetical protein